MICVRLGQEEDGLAGRESRDRSESTELGTSAEEARAQALEVTLDAFSTYLAFFLFFCMFSLVSFSSTSIF